MHQIEKDFIDLLNYKKITLPTKKKYGWLFFLILVVITAPFKSYADILDNSVSGLFLISLLVIKILHYGLIIALFIEVVSALLGKNKPSIDQ